MVRSHPRAARVRRRRPRACGDGPTSLRLWTWSARSAPRLRGWSGVLRFAWQGHPVGPAPAGMVRCPRCTSGRSSCRPRACGDGPRHHHSVAGEAASAPRLRGWSVEQPVEDLARSVGPAPAGMVPASPSRPSRRWSRPRACGDGPWAMADAATAATSAPRLRGWSSWRWLGHRPALGRPRACGDGPAIIEAGLPARGRPRACGDGPTRCGWPSGWAGSAPRVRSRRPRPPPRSCRPRACGDGPSTSARAVLLDGSAPRLRGWSAAGARRADSSLVGSAPAGMILSDTPP